MFQNSAGLKPLWEKPANLPPTMFSLGHQLASRFLRGETICDRTNLNFSVI